jgi:hypothetical protein
MAAVKTRALDMVELLVQAGADINLCVQGCGQGESPLLLSTESFVPVEIFEYLINLPQADLNNKHNYMRYGHNNNTLLMCVIHNDTKPYHRLKLLLEKGVKISDLEFMDATDIDIEIVKLLLDAGYRCSAEVYKALVRNKKIEICQMLLSLDNVEYNVITATRTMLIENYGFTNIMASIGMGDLEAARQEIACATLEELGPKCNQENILHMSARLGLTDIVCLLLDKGMQIDAAAFEKAKLSGNKEIEHAFLIKQAEPVIAVFSIKLNQQITLLRENSHGLFGRLNRQNATRLESALQRANGCRQAKLSLETFAAYKAEGGESIQEALTKTAFAGTFTSISTATKNANIFIASCKTVEENNDLAVASRKP